MTDPDRPSPTEPGSASDDPPTHTSAAPAPSRQGPWVIYGAMFVLLVVAAGALVLVLSRSDESAATEYRVVIPEGTGAQIDAGEPVELIPAELALDLYTSFVVENHDTQLHEVGPFSVRPGETLSYQFTQPGTYKGVCTVHPSGDVTIVVT
jgi:hypothetical protein